MEQEKKDDLPLKTWEKPELISLDVGETEVGGGGVVTDFTNTTTGTAPS